MDKYTYKLLSYVLVVVSLGLFSLVIKVRGSQMYNILFSFYLMIAFICFANAIFGINTHISTLYSVVLGFIFTGVAMPFGLKGQEKE